MTESILRMMSNTSVRDVSELPIFAEGKYTNLKLALERGIFDKPTYFYASDLGKLGYIDSNLSMHIGEDTGVVLRVPALPNADDAKNNVLYIFNNVAYLFNNGVFEPLAKDWSSVIENIQLEIQKINSSISDINTRLDNMGSSENITEAATVLQFPTIGKPNHTYVCLSENATYRWDEDNLHYVCTGRDYTQIKRIIGGDSVTQ